MIDFRGELVRYTAGDRVLGSNFGPPARPHGQGRLRGDGQRLFELAGGVEVGLRGLFWRSPRHLQYLAMTGSIGNYKSRVMKLADQRRREFRLIRLDSRLRGNDGYRSRNDGDAIIIFSLRFSSNIYVFINGWAHRSIGQYR